MNNILAMLCSDTYKQCHPRMYPEGTTQLVSYWVPRRSMLATDEMVFFGLQAFIKKYLVKMFNENFFRLPREQVEKEYVRVMSHHIDINNVEKDRVMALYDLGHLPILIRAIPEGTKVPMGVPCIEIFALNTQFAWVVQWIECILQMELWKPCAHATMASEYRAIANEYYEKTVDDAKPAMAMSDFGMRGMSCLEEACKASASWLLSFNKTSTIPSLCWIEDNYVSLPDKVGIGAVSTEHSVMSANFAIDGDEISFVKRALTELYPNTSFSMVSDTYDYWNMINNILPACKEEILAHNGTLLIRPDSGDIIDISIKTIKSLWDTFGGTTNSKGYKLLDSHIKVIYGDGCTLGRVKEIYKQLEQDGFAANNIFFGIGAFSFAAHLDENGMVVYTRDTYGIAMKATYAIINRHPYALYKDPKTDTSHLKKSHKGCVRVYKNENGKLCAQDGYTHLCDMSDTLLETVFVDGELVKEESFETIRERLNETI